jgi:anti-sigma factor RsiW
MIEDEFDENGEFDDAATASLARFSTIVNEVREAVNDRFNEDVDAALDALADRLKEPKTFLGAARSLWYSSGAAAAVAAALAAFASNAAGWLS